ncbi:MAG: hypothetical protein JWP25_6495 [Bradyrhizobium sp.]|nr:hypothetical protein [Bradyrhizobium sp.]
MPIFFFDLTSAGTLTVDEVGTEFASLEDAYLDTCRAALDMSFEKLGTRDDPYRDSFDILDASRRPLMHVPFSDVLQPKPSARQTVERRWNETFASCRREMARGRLLRAEVGSELRKVQMTSLVILANLNRLKAASGDK